MPSISLSFRTEEETRDRLDAIAGALDRNRNFCINEAVKAYIELHQWQIEHIQQGIADSEAGRTFSADEVVASLAEHHAKRQAEISEVTLTSTKR